MKKVLLVLGLLLLLAYPALAEETKMGKMMDDMHEGQKIPGMEVGVGNPMNRMHEVSIHVEIYNNYSKVEIEMNNNESSMILHTTTPREIIDAIVNKTGLSRPVVVNSIRMEIKNHEYNPWRHHPLPEKIREKRERYMEIMEKRKEMREEYLKKYNEARNLYQKLKHRGLGDPVVFNTTKDYVIYGMDFIITHLDSLELRIEALNLNNSTSQEIANDILTIKSEIGYWKDRINNSTTPQELRDSVLAFSKEWKVLRVKIGAVTGKVLSLKLLDIIDQAKEKSPKIEGKIADLENRSIDTSKLREAYARYLENLDSAREHALNSIAHFNNAMNSSDLGTALKEFAQGKSEYMKAVSDMKKSLGDIKMMFLEYRNAVMTEVGGGGES